MANNPGPDKKAGGALQLAPGTSLGKYQKYIVRHMLKEGGMAEVYLCSQHGPKGFEKLVAIKRIKPAFWNDHEFAQMFINEARLVAKLSHPNVVQILDFDEHDGIQFYAMEYVRGHSLYDVINQSKALGNPFPPLLAVQIGLSVAQALDHAHKAKNDNGQLLNIVHRDVSPQNILLSHDGVVKLTDFGIAKSRTSDTGARGLKGKPRYMSPEQADCKPIDARTDLFALGIVMWELLTGGQLFAREDDLAVLNAVRSSLVTPPARLNPDVPAELSELVMRALEREPAHRLQTAEEMQRALNNILLRRANSLGDTELSRALTGLVLNQSRPSDEPDLAAYLAELFDDKSVHDSIPGHLDQQAITEIADAPLPREPTVSMRGDTADRRCSGRRDDDACADTVESEPVTVRTQTKPPLAVEQPAQSPNRARRPRSSGEQRIAKEKDQDHSRPSHSFHAPTGETSFLGADFSLERSSAQTREPTAIETGHTASLSPDEDAHAKTHLVAQTRPEVRLQNDPHPLTRQKNSRPKLMVGIVLLGFVLALPIVMQIARSQRSQPTGPNDDVEYGDRRHDLTPPATPEPDGREQSPAGTKQDNKYNDTDLKQADNDPPTTPPTSDSGHIVEVVLPRDPPPEKANADSDGPPIVSNATRMPRDPCSYHKRWLRCADIMWQRKKTESSGQENTIMFQDAMLQLLHKDATDACSDKENLSKAFQALDKFIDSALPKYRTKIMACAQR